MVVFPVVIVVVLLVSFLPILSIILYIIHISSPHALLVHSVLLNGFTLPVWIWSNHRKENGMLVHDTVIPNFFRTASRLLLLVLFSSPIESLIIEPPPTFFFLFFFFFFFIVGNRLLHKHRARHGLGGDLSLLKSFQFNGVLFAFCCNTYRSDGVFSLYYS